MAQQIRPVAWNFETPEVNRLIAPIQQGFRDYRAAEQQSVDNERQNKLLGFQEQRLGMEQKRFDSQSEKDRLTALGKASVAVFEMPDGPEKQARAKALMDGHADLAPQFQKYGVNLANPTQAVGFLAQSWGEYDPLAVKAKQAQIAQSQAATAASTQSASQSAQLFPLQLEGAQIDAQSKKRAFENPQPNYEKVPENTRLVQTTGTPDGRPVEVLGPGKKDGITDPKDRAGVEHQLRSEISSLSKDFVTVRDQTANLEAIGKNPSAASDIALIFAYMKILDPSSVVRETEFATAQNAAGVPDRVANVWNRVLSGERLNPAQRADFLRQAQTIASTHLKQYTRRLDQYKGVAERIGVDPRNVILDNDVASPAGVAVGNSRVGATPPSPVTTSEPPPAAVQMLRSNRNLSAAFDEKYGAGAAARVLGGR